MGLEHVIGASAMYEDISRIAKGFSDKPSNYKLIKEYAQKYVARNPEDEAEVNMHYGALKRASPAVVQENIDIRQKSVGANTAAIVAANMDDILKADSGIVYTAAFSLEGILKEEKEVGEALKKGDHKKIKQIYIELYGKNPAVKHFAEEVADAEFFMKFYPKAIETKKKAFLAQFSDEDGDKPTVNEDKLRAYVRSKIASIKDEKKPEAYLDIGIALYALNEERRKAAEAEKKSQEEKKKKKS